MEGQEYDATLRCQTAVAVQVYKPVLLVPGVEYYFAAAMVGPRQRDIQSLLLGDLLVRLNSAVGEHSDNTRCIDIEPGNCRIFYCKNHIDLLGDQAVQTQIIDWLSPKLH